jgi:hypothetical protein
MCEILMLEMSLSLPESPMCPRRRDRCHGELKEQASATECCSATYTETCNARSCCSSARKDEVLNAAYISVASDIELANVLTQHVILRLISFTCVGYENKIPVVNSSHSKARIPKMRLVLSRAESNIENTDGDLEKLIRGLGLQRPWT